MFDFVRSMQVCFEGTWAAGCEAIWVISFFTIVAFVVVAVLALRRSIKENSHRRSVNKWFAEQAETQDED